MLILEVKIVYFISVYLMLCIANEVLFSFFVPIDTIDFLFYWFCLPGVLKTSGD